MVEIHQHQWLKYKNVIFIDEKWLDEDAIYHPKWDELNNK
jgi:hypothetical protein